MKKTLFKYMLKEIAVPFLLGIGVFTFVLLMGRFLKLADLVISKGVPLTDVLKLLLYIFPSFSLVTIPMAFLLAMLLAFGRLSSDSEITAIKSSGISLYGLLPPILTFAALAYTLTTFITIYALPWGNTAFKSLLVEIVETRASLTMKEKVFNDDFPGLVIYVDSYRPELHTISGILIQDERNPEEPSTIFAKTGTIVSDPAQKNIRLQLQKGGIHRCLGASGYRLIEFATYDLRLNLNRTTKEGIKDESDMTFLELRNNMKKSLVTEKEQRTLALEFHRRFSLPFACFVFALVGMPLGLQNQRAGKAGGFSLSIGLLLFYYVLLSASKTMGEKGLLYPAIAMWIPNLLFLTFGIYLFKKAAAEEAIPLVGLFYRLLEHSRKLLRGRRKRT